MSDKRSFKVRYTGPGRVNYAFDRPLYRGDSKPLWHNFYETFELGVPGGHRDEVDKEFMVKLQFFIDRPDRFKVNTTGMGKAYNAKSKVSKVKDAVKKITAPKEIEGTPEEEEEIPPHVPEELEDREEEEPEKPTASKAKGKKAKGKKAKGGSN